MSMNLYCEGVHLLQTPTLVTEEILAWDEWGQPRGGWEGVANRYIAWLESERAKCAKPPTPWYTDPTWVWWTETIEEFRAVVEQAKREKRVLRFSRI